MAKFSPLFIVAFLAIHAVSARVVVKENHATLPFATKLNLKSGVKLADIDRSRAKASVQRSLRRKPSTPKPVNVPITNAAVTYLATVGVGNPPTDFSLLIDTGSSNTWVGATQPFVQTNTTVSTGVFVEVTYGSGDFFGQEVLDQVTIAPNLVIKNQSIGAAIFSSGFQGMDGILGIGPVDLTVDTLSSPDSDNTIPTVTDNLFAQKTIPQNLIGISFEPTTSVEVTNGELTFGGTDSSKFTGDIHFTPVTSTSPSSLFWGIDQSITYGTDSTPLLSLTSGIVDTGTTLLLLASDALATYQSITGAVFDDNTGLLSLTQDQFNNLQSLFFNINGVDFEFTPNAQLFPRALNVDIGGQADGIYLIVGDIGSPSGQGFDFVNGFAFLERFYSVFDTTNNQVGLATTPFTNATTN